MSKLGKPFPKMRSENKKQKINVQIPHVNKDPLATKMEIWFKQKTRPRMNYK